jgi:hypothetical protein
MALNPTSSSSGTPNFAIIYGILAEKAKQYSGWLLRNYCTVGNL